MKNILWLSLLASASLSAVPAETSDDAARFGKLPYIYSLALSADGKQVVIVAPGTGRSTNAAVLDLTSMKLQAIAHADSNPTNITHCEWSAADRIVCQLRGLTRTEGVLIPVGRTLAMDSDGSKMLALGQRDTSEQLYGRQFDGDIVDWMDGRGGAVLMMRTNVPEMTTGKRTARTDEGRGVDRIDTRTGQSTTVERPDSKVIEFISDGLGTIRVKTTTMTNSEGMLKGINKHYYRAEGAKDWRELGIDDAGSENASMQVLAVDPIIDAAYVLQPLNGRQALYRIALDGSMMKQLVFASPEVDVEDVVRIGRGGRVIGAAYVTDRRKVEYFDPTYRGIAASLGNALPKLPLIQFVSASADEQVLMVWAGSDVDPGHYYLLDRRRNQILDVLKSRPDLVGMQLSPVKAITFPAADGTQIPAYLTLPPGVNDAKNLPAIVMPHGGPAARDEWGFDWLAQYFAHRGYAVLQPNYRGSSGYGDQWYVNNGFQSWKTSIGDVCDSGRWLVKQGIADASKLAIFGWSYGGYAALQANVVDSTLFKAVVAVAPVTDLAQVKTQARPYINSNLVDRYIGSGPHIVEGSPARHAEAFQAPVLLFHGDNDLNVDVMQSRRMDEALRGARKSSQLVVYPHLEHSLLDSAGRADMLRRSDAFLREHLKL